MSRRTRMLLSGYPRAAPLLVGLLVMAGTLIRIPQLFHPLAEAYSFRQTQTAFAVREFAAHGIDLSRSPLPIFGPDASVPLEFPLFQAIASLLVHLGMPADMASRTLGLIAFQASAVLLATLAARWHGRVVAVIAVILFEFLPFGLLWGAASLIDFFSVALALLMVLGLDHWFQHRSIPWLVAGSAGAVTGFLVKVTTMPPWGLLVLVSLIIVVNREGLARVWRRTLIGLISGPALGFVLAIAWTVYADQVKQRLPLTSYLVSSNLREWNFGSLKQRLDPASYQAIADRIAQEIAGPALVLLLTGLVAAIFQSRFADRFHTVGWLAAAICGPLLFFNLYVVHAYYLIAVYPAMVAAGAVGLTWTVRALPGATWQRVAAGAAAIGLLLFATATSPNGRADIGQFAIAQPVPRVATDIAAATDPDDLIVMVGCDWDPTWLFYAEREGVMFWIGDPQDFWADHPIEDYPYLFSCSGVTDGYLPPGAALEPTEVDGLYRVVVE